MPAPIDVQIEGTDGEGNRKIADRMLQQLHQVPGLVDLRIQQPEDYPVFDVNVDRTKAEQGGYTEHDVATSLLNTLSGSFQVQPMFFLNYQNGVNYNLVAQTPQYQMQTLQDLKGIPITAGGMTKPEILADVASVSRADTALGVLLTRKLTISHARGRAYFTDGRWVFPSAYVVSAPQRQGPGVATTVRGRFRRSRPAPPRPRGDTAAAVESRSNRAAVSQHARGAYA